MRQNSYVFHCTPRCLHLGCGFYKNGQRAFGSIDGHQSTPEKWLNCRQNRCAVLHRLLSLTVNIPPCFSYNISENTFHCSGVSQVLNAIFAFCFSVHFNKLGHGVTSPVGSSNALASRFQRWGLSGKSIASGGGRREEGNKPKGGCSITCAAPSRVVPTDGHAT